MKRLGIFDSVSDEVGEIIVADVDGDVVEELVAPESAELEKLIAKA